MSRGIKSGFRRDYPGAPTGGGPHFKGAITAATAITAAANMIYPSVEDTHAGYSAGTYTIKRAGIYLITVSLQWSGTPPAGGSAINIFRNGTQRLNGRVAAQVNFGGPLETWLTRCAVGDTITVQSSATFTTVAAPAGTENSVWSITWQRP